MNAQDLAQAFFGNGSDGSHSPHSHQAQAQQGRKKQSVRFMPILAQNNVCWPHLAASVRMQMAALCLQALTCVWVAYEPSN